MLAKNPTALSRCPHQASVASGLCQLPRSVWSAFGSNNGSMIPPINTMTSARGSHRHRCAGSRPSGKYIGTPRTSKYQPTARTHAPATA